MAGLYPDRFFTRITAIDIEHDILDCGFRCVMLDMDNTILPRDTHQVPADIREWLDSAKAAGLRLCLLSNNFHHGVYEWAQRLDMPVVAKAVKPLPHGFIRARHVLGCRRRETLMIGDQMITDVWGAHFTGHKVYMVLPLVQTDLWHTLLLRNLERVILGKRKPER